MARRRSRHFGFAMKIPKSAYQKAIRKGAGRRKAPKSVTNRDRSVVELYRFQTRKKHGPWTGYLKGQKVTNFTGLRICTVEKRSSGRTGGFARGAQRVTVIAKCIDGRKYVGRGPGDGMYLRLTPKRGR